MAAESTALAGPPAPQEPGGFPPGPFRAGLLLHAYGSCFNGTRFGRKAGITRARMDRISDHFSGAWVHRKYCSGCGGLFLIPWIKTNKAPRADQKGRCGVRREGTLFIIRRRGLRKTPSRRKENPRSSAVFGIHCQGSKRLPKPNLTQGLKRTAGGRVCRAAVMVIRTSGAHPVLQPALGPSRPAWKASQRT